MPSLGAVLMEENDEAYDKIKELEGEIRQLRAINNVYEETIKSLEEENGKLKSELKERVIAHQNFDRLYYELKEENKKLKSVNQELRDELRFDEKMYKTFKEIIDEADDLIMSHLSTHYQRLWKNFCRRRGVNDD